MKRNGGRPQLTLNSKDSNPPSAKTTGTCNICGQEGHFAKDCRFKEKIQKLIAEGKITCITTATILLEEAQHGKKGSILGSYDVLLDNVANVSVFCNPELLDNIREGDPLEITGVGPSAIQCDQVGDFGIFGTVYLSPTARANILCFDDIADMFEVLWDQEAREFTVLTPAGDFTFKRRNKM